MANLQYIGARYVPKFYLNPDDSSNDWKSGVLYEALTIVTYNNDSYTSRETVPASVGNPADNPSYWACTTKYTAALVALQSSVGALEGFVNIDELLTAAQDVSGAINELVGDIGDVNTDIANLGNDITDLDNKIDRSILATGGRPCIGNLLLNHFYDTNSFHYNPQGACSIGNNLIVQYYSSTVDNTGLLVCYDLVNHTKEWEHVLPCYHGNSVTYNPNTNMLYISGCVTYDLNTYVNMIFEVDLANPSVINRTITLPDTTTNYSLTYDAYKNVFYAINNIGTTEGIANVLTIYNSTLTQTVRNVLLENYPPVRYNLSTQGVQLGIDGVAYCLVYSKPFYVVGYDVETGKMVNVFNLPRLLSGYREYHESEALIYEPDTKNMYVSAISRDYNLALKGYRCANIFEIDAFHGIEQILVEPFEYGVIDYYEPRITARMILNELIPAHLTNKDQVVTAQDAVNYAKVKGAIRCVFYSSRTANEVYKLRCDGVTIRFQAQNATHIKFNELSASQSRLAFWYSDFEENFEWTANQYAQAAFILSDIFMMFCKFTDNNAGADPNTTHVSINNGCNMFTRGVTMEGSYANDYYQGYSILNGVYA